MAVRVWVKRVLVVMAVLFAISVAVLAWLLRTGDLEETLIARAKVIYAPRERLSHVDEVTPGSLGDAVQPVLAPLKASYEAWKALPDGVRADCNGVVKGEKPLRELPEECLVLVERNGPAAAAVIKGTHAQQPNLPPAFSPIRAEFWQPASESMQPVLHAVTLAGLQMRRSLEAGDAPNALAICIDALALGRDLSYQGGYVSLLFSRSAVRQASRPCVDSILASPTAADEVAKQLAAIRDEWSPFDRVILEEAVFMETKCAGMALSLARLDRLPVEVSALAKAQAMEGGSWLMNKGLPLGWRTFDQGYPAVEAALHLPLSQQDAALERIDQADADSPNPLRDLFGMKSVRSFRQKYVRTMDTLTALVATARAVDYHEHQDRWPNRAELEEFVPGLKESAVQIDASNDAFTLELPAAGEEEAFRVAVGVIATPTDPVP